MTFSAFGLLGDAILTYRTITVQIKFSNAYLKQLKYSFLCVEFQWDGFENAI